MLKHIFFDLDNTLTPSRRPLKPEHVPLFERLCRGRDVIVVTGGTKAHIEEQLGSSRDNYFILAQSGNHCLDKSGAELWYEPLTEVQKHASFELIARIKGAFALQVKDESDLIDDRGAQIGYSVIGYHEEPTKKDAFDPDFSRRKAMLAGLADGVEALRAVGIEVFPAGSSGYNFTLIGKDKGVNVARLIAHEQWVADECIYVGDALGPGENDFSVVGVIATHSVKGPDETFRFIEGELSV